MNDFIKMAKLNDLNNDYKKADKIDSLFIKLSNTWLNYLGVDQNGRADPNKSNTIGITQNMDWKSPEFAQHGVGWSIPQEKFNPTLQAKQAAAQNGDMSLINQEYQQWFADYGNQKLVNDTIGYYNALMQKYPNQTNTSMYQNIYNSLAKKMYEQNVSQQLIATNTMPPEN